MVWKSWTHGQNVDLFGSPGAFFGPETGVMVHVYGFHEV